MKYLVLTFTLCLFCSLSFGQNFEVVSNNSSFTGSIGDQIKAPVTIKNLSDKPIQIVFKRIDKLIGSSQRNYFCWDEECYETTTDEIPLSKRINPGEISNKFESILEAGLVAGISTVKYLIYDRDNPSETIEYEISYIVEEEANPNAIFSTSEIRINEVYPNPVREFAIVDYNLHTEEIEAKIVLHNVLGSVVGEYELSYFETKVKINTEEFNPGVYFYTLHLDNDGVLTKKLIIRK
ncbi:MAG: T9SS type A sorting domain-containing protein [Bacteroidota bacterium]